MRKIDWSLSHFWHGAPKTLGISCDKGERGVFCYVNEVTFRPHSRARAVCLKDQPLGESLYNFLPNMHPLLPIQDYLGREEELEIRSANDNDLVSHDYVMKPPQKT